MSRITGEVDPSTQMDGLSVDLELSGGSPVLSYTLSNVTLRGQIDERRDAFFSGL